MARRGKEFWNTVIKTLTVIDREQLQDEEPALNKLSTDLDHMLKMLLGYTESMLHQGLQEWPGTLS